MENLHLLSGTRRYLELFTEADKEQATGEISTPYLYLFEKQ